MFVLRWIAVVNPGWTLLLALFIYYAAIVWLHWDHGNKWLIFQPFYCLFVSLIVVPIGVAYYFKMAIPERNFGVIRPKRKDLVSGLILILDAYRSTRERSSRQHSPARQRAHLPEEEGGPVCSAWEASRMSGERASTHTRLERRGLTRRPHPQRQRLRPELPRRRRPRRSR